MVNSMAHVGQRYQKADCASLVFEVVKHIEFAGLPHVRLARVDLPPDIRTYSVAAVTNRHHFHPIEARDQAAPQASEQRPMRPLGPGDQAFLGELELLPRPAAEAGRELLARLRRLRPGDLLPGKDRRYVETPAKFWAVRIQPRDGTLAVQVRGQPAEYLPTSLILRRNGVTHARFKIDRPEDVDETLEIIARAAKLYVG